MPTMDDAVRIMKRYVEQVEQCRALHFVAKADWKWPVEEELASLDIRLGPIRIEGWFRRPDWRLEAAYGGKKEVTVLIEASTHAYELAENGQWVRRPKLVKTTPDGLLATFFALDKASTVTYVTIESESLGGKPVWVIEGMGARGERVTWWIDKAVYMVRRFEHKGGHFEFEYERETKRVPFPHTQVVEFELVEFPSELPRELFMVPSDAPFAERVTDKFTEWFEQWLTGGAASP